MPFYRARAPKLPERFDSWDTVKSSLPPTGRATVQQEREALAFPAPAPASWRTTGGSTAQPVQLPAWKEELRYARRDAWYCRSWFGIEPDDRLFMIWGHSHLLGTGIRGWINGHQRRVKDRLLGYHRCSAYDIGASALGRAADALLRFEPAYVIAYATALDRFARVNAPRRDCFHGLRLKAAIATAESFPSPDSAELIADVLGCPVAMEYGAVETGVLAHQRPGDGYSVMWRHHYLEIVPSAQDPGTGELLVTSLYRRCFPLIRYKLGDLIRPCPGDRNIGTRFGAVHGRCNEVIALSDGAVVHSEAFAHAVKDLESIHGFQVVQSDEGIRFHYLAEQELTPDGLGLVRQRLMRIHPELERADVVHVPELTQTIAGKTRSILQRRNGG